MTTEPRRILVITGTRAEYGLLKTVIHAIKEHPLLALRLGVTGTHLLTPHMTINEIERDFPIDLQYQMQRFPHDGRIDDVAAIARAMKTLANYFNDITNDVVLVLGDRIEAFAAASAASIAGIRVAHIHGGDRAEGVADESMRHAITKLAHIHFPATSTSARRIEQMGEHPATIHTVGSPSIDALNGIPPLEDDLYQTLGHPQVLVCMHPTGRRDEEEHADMIALLEASVMHGRVLVMDPNHDAGHNGITRAIEERTGIARCSNLPRNQFIGLLRRVAVVVGNSSGGLIECAAIQKPVINIGARQNGREQASNVTNVISCNIDDVSTAIKAAMTAPTPSAEHPYGDGKTGQRIADTLASFDLHAHPITKRNTY